MGIGLHVDHLIAHTSLRSVFGNAVRFYEDLPYVAWPDTFDIRMAQLADAPRSAHAIAIDATLTQKIHAIHAYPSQLYELFGGAEAMEQQIAGYAASVAPTGAHYGERVWQLG
jgi:hypothetical protein